MAQTLREQGEIIRANIPLGRIGTPEDVAGACIFLASRAGAWVNGATITLNGGQPRQSTRYYSIILLTPYRIVSYFHASAR